MSGMTRKGFIGTLLSTTTLVAVGALPKEDHDLDDIYDDKYYDLQGGPYKDTGGVGAPGKSWRFDLIRILRNEDSHNRLDRCIDNIERHGFYFTVSLYVQHSHDEWVAYGHKKIPLTREWLTNFYNKHKMDT